MKKNNDLLLDDLFSGQQLHWPTSSHLRDGFRQGTASAVPNRANNSGVLTSEAVGMAGDSFYETGCKTPAAEARSLSRPLAEICASCGAFEWVTFLYLAWLNTILLLFHRNVPHAALYFAIHCGVAIGILTLSWAAARSQNSVVRFARDWYPLPLYICFFEELQVLVHAIFPGWFDRWLIEFDYGFAGVHPSVWLARFSSHTMNEFMQFAYMTYFLYLIILPAILYVNKDRLAYWTVMVSTAVAHYSVYMIALLFPIESPYYSLASLASNPHPSGWFTDTIGFIERFARVHGAAFPSAHVAGSMVALLAAYRYRRWLFWICLPFFASMCVATIYGRYHYVADVLAGIVVGAIGFAAGSTIMERKGALAGIAE
jgi:membrane-associated phospholipid phosphatase